VKNQYFGDTRDLFKYDLALHIIEGIWSIRALTFVPMLTPDDGSRQGSRTDHRKGRQATGNPGLSTGLQGASGTGNGISGRYARSSRRGVSLSISTG